MPYILGVQAVIETSAFLQAARQVGMREEEREALVSLVASDPTAGKLMQGTGGCRKLRFRRPGSGKSGGYRAITYFGGDDIPLVLITVFAKNERANLTKAERNDLAKLVVRLEDGLRNRKI